MNDIYISKDTNIILLNYLENLNIHINMVKNSQKVYESVSSHGDIFYCRLGTSLSSEVLIGDENLIGFNYPENIRYNCVFTEKYLIHNLKYTDPKILQRADELGLKKINVKQGYTKCNIVVVDDSSFITSDKGIYKALLDFDPTINALLVDQGQVILKGFPYGFLGGASGKVGETIIFNGNLEAHSNYKQIKEFILGSGKELKYFTQYPLEDIGSIV